MNFTRIRRLIQYLLLLYVLALTDLWSTLSRIWRRDQSRFILEETPVEKVNPLSSLKFVKPVLVAVAESPIKVRKMIFPQGVPIFADHSDEHGPENSNDDDDDIDNLFADAVGSMNSDWAAGPRDETTLPRILLAMKSSNKSEADYALNEMVKIIEKIDMDAHADLVGKAFESFVKVSQDRAQSDYKSTNILNHLPFLYSCSTSSDEFAHYGDQMLDYLIQCLKASEMHRRSAIYATTALLERDSISEVDLRNKIVPTLFDLLLEEDIIEEHRNELATALCRIAQSRLDPKWTFENFIPKFSLLLRDEHVHVKKAALAICGHLSKEFGGKFTEEFVVPHVVALITDGNWSIRKIICEIIVEVSHNCPPDVRKNLLAPNFIHLLRDTSRWVAYQAFQELGPFISTFADSSITGLNINEMGQVVSDGSMSTNKKEDFQYEKLPEGIYVPQEDNNSRYRPFSQEEADNVLGEMTSMLDNWDHCEFRGPSSMDNRTHTSVAAKCSSVEDLTSLDFDYAEQSFFVEEDQDEIMEESERKKQVESQVTYWSASPDIIDISEEINIFIANSVTNSLNKLALTNSDVQKSPSSTSKSDTINTFTDQSSDMNSFTSEPEETDDDMDPFRDCRGNDDEEERMDTSDGEASEPLIPHIPQPNHVPKDLVENFLTMAAPSSQTDPDINRYCAHNFPAVAYTLGRDSWLLLKDAYKRLSNEDVRVRKTIASSLHEIGRIVGEEKTDSDLLPIFNQYKDDAPEIRYNILKNLFEFFQCLSSEKRASMINVLPEIMPVSTNTLRNDWRYRQCRKLCSLYGNEEINRTISAIALTMANDRIAEVRTEAVLLIVEIIRRLVNAETPNSGEQLDEKMSLTANLLKDVITSFAKTQKWSRRLTFTHICHGLLQQKALSQYQFRYFLLAQLFGMTSDKVANVRLSACKVLALLDHDLSPQPIGGETTPTVKEVLKKLSNDNDIDVAREARLTLKEMTEDKTDIALRGRKIKLREGAFFKDKDVSSYEVKDMSETLVQNLNKTQMDNYEVVDMDISDGDSRTEEPNTSEC